MEVRGTVSKHRDPVMPSAARPRGRQASRMRGMLSCTSSQHDRRRGRGPTTPHWRELQVTDPGAARPASSSLLPSLCVSPARPLAPPSPPLFHLLRVLLFTSSLYLGLSLSSPSLLSHFPDSVSDTRCLRRPPSPSAPAGARFPPAALCSRRRAASGSCRAT